MARSWTAGRSRSRWPNRARPAAGVATAAPGAAATARAAAAAAEAARAAAAAGRSGRTRPTRLPEPGSAESAVLGQDQQEPADLAPHEHARSLSHGPRPGQAELPQAEDDREQAEPVPRVSEIPPRLEESVTLGEGGGERPEHVRHEPLRRDGGDHGQARAAAAEDPAQHPKNRGDR